jgi:hypothetical protein
MTFLALVISFIYPLAGLVHAVFSLGVMLERRREITRRQWVMLATSILIMAAVVRHLTARFHMALDPSTALRFIAFRMTEVNHYVAATSFLMCILTIGSLEIRSAAKIWMIIALIVASFAMYECGLPLVVLWIFLCLAKTALLRKWSLTLLLAGVSLYAIIPPGGTPAYAIFSVMTSAAIVPIGWSALENRLGIINNRSAAALGILLMGLLIVLRSGVHVPVASRLATPLLAEREKTYQLQHVIGWVLSSEYRNYGIGFSQEDGPQDESASALNRVHRPPSSDKYLDRYMAYVRRGQKQIPEKLIVSFGGEKIAGAAEVYRVHGRYAGDAIVYRRA